MVTVKQLKAKLKRLGVKKDEFANLRKAELETLLAQHEGGNGGGNVAGTGQQPAASKVSVASQKSAIASIHEAAAAAGPAAVTAAAAEAGVVAASGTATRGTRKKKSSPKKGAKQKTKKAQDFLRTSEKAFGPVKTHMKIHIARQRKLAEQESAMKGVEATESGALGVWPPQLPEGMQALDFTQQVSPTFRIGKPMKKRKDYSRRECRVKFKNIHNEPVMLRTSWLPPSFHPRPAAIFPILGHKNPLDPGAQFDIELPAGLTVYAVNRKGEALESFVTSGDTNVSPRHIIHSKQVRPGKVEIGGFELEGVYSDSPSPPASKSPKGKKKGGRRRTRRKRRRRRRRKTRRRRGGELFGFRRWVKKKTGYTARKEAREAREKREKRDEETEKALRRLEADANNRGVINNR